MNNFFSLSFEQDNFTFIDQTKLPLSEIYVTTDNYERIAEAIEKLEIRGAPAIGIAAAYGIALSFKFHNGKDNEYFNSVSSRLKRTRPTAVNLFWAIKEMEETYNSLSSTDNIFNRLKEKAIIIHNDDIQKCEMMAKNGVSIFHKKSIVLTHCNTGKLATGGGGTALNVIKHAFKKGLIEHVYVDETRPLLQGARLTTFELSKESIPFYLITDSTAAFLMQQNKVDLVITGADRIAVNGDSANKIGTYNLAVNCKYHGIPFYIAAPTTTIDYNCLTGKDIPIEERNKLEINRIKDIKVTKSNYSVYNPSFDITPNELITGIITENKLYNHPYCFNV
ncbi:MAG: S-methyl-5-thioribose-1-phosphate isomerase [bacterium]